MTPDQVRGWARYLDTSPLYQQLIEVIASDSDLLAVLNRIDHTPRLNMLFAGVQYLMMAEGGGELARHFPNLSSEPPGVTLGPAFTEFVLAHEAALVEIGRTRYTQTNECRRCVMLLAGIWETPAVGFHLVDVGTSAGLNLLLDRYHYTMGTVEWGPSSPVRLTTEMRGRAVEARDIEIWSRTGLDLNPIDPSIPDDARWLEALVWPENQERRERLRAALGLTSEVPTDLVEGNALETLPVVLAGMPPGEPVVVMNSFVLNQMSRADRAAMSDIISDHRADRVVYRVSCEWLEAEDEGAAIEVDDGSGLRRVGVAHPHGVWLKLYASP